MTGPPMLPDVLQPGLDVVFVGTAAGARSAREGIYYAHPQNRFWRTLRQVGLLPTGFRAEDFRDAVGHGIGFTDLCKSQAGMDRSIDDYDRAGFRRKMSEMNPRAIAFTSKKAASVWLGCKTSEILAGQQPDRDLGATIFALPSPSGAAGGHWDLGPWQAMADWVKADRLLNPSRYRSSRRTSAAPAASAASLA